MKKLIYTLCILLLCGVLVFLYFSHFPKETVPEDGSLKKVQDRGTLVVGTSFPYGIMEFLDEDSNPAGVDVEIAKEIARALNVEIKIVDYAWDDLFIAIKSGSVDIALSSISITPERSTEMLFSIPYFSSGQILITRTDTTEINSLEDIVHKSIGVQEGTTAQSGMEALGTELHIVPYATGPELVQGLIRGDIDVIVTDFIEAITVVTDNPSLTIRGGTFSDESYGVTTKLGNNTLMEKVNEVLYELKTTGKIREIGKKFYNNAQ